MLETKKVYAFRLLRYLVPDRCTKWKKPFFEERICLIKKKPPVAMSVILICWRKVKKTPR